MRNLWFSNYIYLFPPNPDLATLCLPPFPIFLLYILCYLLSSPPESTISNLVTTSKLILLTQSLTLNHNLTVYGQSTNTLKRVRHVVEKSLIISRTSKVTIELKCNQRFFRELKWFFYGNTVKLN